MNRYSLENQRRIFLAQIKANQEGWMEQGACRGKDPESFYPQKKGPEVADAKDTCYACSVKVKCLEFAIETQERYGIWGGMEADERKIIARLKQVGQIALIDNQQSFESSDKSKSE